MDKSNPNHYNPLSVAYNVSSKHFRRLLMPIMLCKDSGFYRLTLYTWLWNCFITKWTTYLLAPDRKLIGNSPNPNDSWALVHVQAKNVKDIVHNRSHMSHDALDNQVETAYDTDFVQPFIQTSWLFFLIQTSLLTFLACFLTLHDDVFNGIMF